jgi:lysylphosphatidylglycerol synthetase-like protein (DUF2156 family)
MSNVLRRIEIPIAITIVAVLVQVIPYYLDAGTALNATMNGASDFMQKWMLIVIALATLVGVISVFQVHGKNLQKRGKDWYFSVIVLVVMVIMIVAGLPIQEITLGPTNTVYLFFFNNFYTPLSGTMYAIIAFFITSAAFRAFRARNLEATLVLLAGILMVMSNAPLFTASWGGFKTIGDWIMNVPNMATMRAVTIGIALGTIALAVRTLMGIERGYLRGGSES